MSESYRLETALVYIRRIRGICNKAGHTQSIHRVRLFVFGWFRGAYIAITKGILKIVYRNLTYLGSRIVKIKC